MRARTLALMALLGLSLSACTLWPEKKNPGWNHATGIEQFERLYWQELQKRNWKEIEARTASNFTHTSATGVKNKQQTLATYQRYPLIEHSLGDFEIVSHGDTAIAHFTALFSYQDETGKTIGPVRNRVMTVWQQHKSGWVVVAKSVTPLE
jgi:hypothetical protein